MNKEWMQIKHDLIFLEVNINCPQDALQFDYLKSSVINLMSINLKEEDNRVFEHKMIHEANESIVYFKRNFSNAKKELERIENFINKNLELKDDF